MFNRDVAVGATVLFLVLDHTQINAYVGRVLRATATIALVDVAAGNCGKWLLLSSTMQDGNEQNDKIVVDSYTVIVRMSRHLLVLDNVNIDKIRSDILTRRAINASSITSAMKRRITTKEWLKRDPHRDDR